MIGKMFLLVLTAVAIAFSSFSAAATTVEIDLVPVGDSGNAADTTGYGRVDTDYMIGMYEVTNIQWREFLTAKASIGDPHGLYSASMGGLGIFGSHGGIDQAGAGTTEEPYVYSSKDGDGNWDDRPVNFVSFWDAARFCNWLHNGQGAGDTESGAYINIGDQTTFARQPDAKFFIPTEDEWYKGAYYDGVRRTYYDFPTSSDTTPTAELPAGTDPMNGSANYGSVVGTLTTVGAYNTKPSESPYGTYDQGGNLWEWNETILLDSHRGLRGGSFGSFDPANLSAADRSNHGTPDYESHGVGFRVASLPVPVPEPGTAAMLWGCILGFLTGSRRRK